MIAYVLTAAAEDDLRGIVRYTRRQWGDAQVRGYMSKLEHGIACLAAGQGTFTGIFARSTQAYGWRGASITMSSVCDAMKPLHW